MACGKKPGTVFSSTYFWSKVTCRECLKHEAFGEVVK